MSQPPAAPAYVAPMLAKLATLPHEDSEWAFEVKWDGVRAIALVAPQSLQLISRTNRDMTTAYPELGGLSAALAPHAAVLDGEIVMFDASGRPSFQALQSRIHLRGEAAVARLANSEPVSYMIFDLLWLDGESLVDVAYAQRRARLDELKLEGSRWHVPEFHRGHGAALLAATREQGLEGIVAKRLDSRYAPGRRVGWIKVKNANRQEAVIGGWTSGKGSREARIGALHLGVHDADGALRYVGRVGSGFDDTDLERLAELLEPIAATRSPFEGRQPPKGAHFVEPRLVCEVQFSEWTHAGTLRQASYKGLRDDKAPADVVRERVDSDPPPAPARAGGPGPRLRAGGSRVRGPGSPVRSPVRDLIDAARRGSGAEIELEGRTLKLTNLDKVLYPATGFTKLDLISYYAAVSPVLLPTLKDRPLTLKRYPNGVGENFFYEKRVPPHRPDWVQSVTVPSGRGKADIPYTLCQDLATLVWLANLADIELHPSLSRAPAIERPTMVTFDLDPGAPANIVGCCAVALLLRELFDTLKLAAVAKTSGSKGLQVMVPLNDKNAGYEQTKSFAHAVAQRLAAAHPSLIVSSMSKEKRTGKVLIDWSQNDAHKTTVSVYSLRATERPAVSAPITWEEITACHERDAPALLSFGPEQVLARQAQNDAFAQVFSMRQATSKLKVA